MSVASADLRGALSDLRDRQEISVGETKVFVNGVAGQMQRLIAAVLGQASEQSIGDPRRDRAFRVAENFTKQRALFLIVHRSKDLLHAVGDILDHVAGGIVHVRAALAIVAFLGRAAVTIGNPQLAPTARSLRSNSQPERRTRYAVPALCGS